MNNKTLILCLLMALMALAGCHKEDIHRGRVPLATVAGEYLYKDEIEILYAIYGHGGDSARFFQEHIEKWAVEHLFYGKATENVALNNDIEKMVDSYRRGLILSLYQDRLVNQQLVSDISLDDIKEFYETNDAMFELEEPMFKGILIKVPQKSPNLNRLRTWFIRKNSDDLEKIEKYSIANSVFYSNFQDDWQTMADIAKLIPITAFQLNQRLKRQETIEFRETGYIYFVSADTIIQKGERKPIEIVSDEITELLINSRKTDFIKEKKQTLYKEALNTGEVKIY